MQQGGPPPMQQGGPPPMQQGGPPPMQQGGPPPMQQGGPSPPMQQGGQLPMQQGGPPPRHQGGPPPRNQGGPPPMQQGGPPPMQQGGPPPMQQGGPPPMQQRGPPPLQQGGPPPIQQGGPLPMQQGGPPPLGQQQGLNTPVVPEELQNPFDTFEPTESPADDNPPANSPPLLNSGSSETKPVVLSGVIMEEDDEIKLPPPRASGSTRNLRPTPKTKPPPNERSERSRMALERAKRGGSLAVNEPVQGRLGIEVGMKDVDLKLKLEEMKKRAALRSNLRKEEEEKLLGIVGRGRKALHDHGSPLAPTLSSMFSRSNNVIQHHVVKTILLYRSTRSQA